MKPHLRRVVLDCRRCDRPASLQIVDEDGTPFDRTFYCDEHGEEALADYLVVAQWECQDVG